MVRYGLLEDFSVYTGGHYIPGNQTSLQRAPYYEYIVGLNHRFAHLVQEAAYKRNGADQRYIYNLTGDQFYDFSYYASVAYIDYDADLYENGYEIFSRFSVLRPS